MDIGGSGGSSSPSEFNNINGLKFGKKIYFGDHMGLLSTPPQPHPPPTKPYPRQQGQHQQQQQQTPRCQVEGCGVDLSDAKAYYSRHKVCGTHSKTPTVVVAGLQQRFCQQCSRFHLLAEFDQGKRSCRRRLAGHNERRRKPSPGSMLSPRYGRLSSTFFDNSSRTGGGFLLDFSAFPKSPPSNETTASRSSTTSHLWQNNHPPPNLYPAGGFPSSAPSGGCYNGVSVVDSSCALSLLSNEQWSSTTRAPITTTTATTITTQYPSTWGFKGSEGMSTSHGTMMMQSDLGLGQVPATGSHLSSELDMPLFPRRQYMDLEEHSRPYGASDQHINWSL